MCPLLPKAFPLITMYQLGDPNTYMSINIYRERHTHSHVSIHIYSHSCSYTQKTLWFFFMDRFQLNQGRSASMRMRKECTFNHLTIHICMYTFIINI